MKTRNYTDMRDAFFEELYLLALADRNVVLIYGDQAAQTYEKFRQTIPGQIINGGIAEQNLIGVAAGLALGGKKVFVHAIAPFITLRCYEQIKVDLGLMSLPVVLAGIGAGYSYGDAGPTHHAVQDLSILRAIPKMTILNASDTVSLSHFTKIAYENTNGPLYLRFDKANPPPIYTGEEGFCAGLAKIRKGKDVIIISTGLMVHRALDAADKLNSLGIDAGVIDMYRIKPLNSVLLAELLTDCKKVVTLEEHGPIGGLGSLISEFLCDSELNSISLKRIALEDSDCFTYGTRDYVHALMGLDTETLVARIHEWFKR
jgi:transketolase